MLFILIIRNQKVSLTLMDYDYIQEFLVISQITE